MELTPEKLDHLNAELRCPDVTAATKLRSVTKPSDGGDRGGEPAASPDCTRTTYASRVPAVQVTYSYRAPSDESGSAWSTFDVYFREDEIDPRLRRALSTGKISRTAAAELFDISMDREQLGSHESEV